MGTATEKRAARLLAGAFGALALAASLAFGVPAPAMAAEGPRADLATMGILFSTLPEAQVPNATMDTAQELAFGKTADAQFEHAEGSFVRLGSRWYKFRAGNHQAAYEVVLSSGSGHSITMTVRDGEGKLQGLPRLTDGRASFSLPDAVAGAWYYIEVSPGISSRVQDSFSVVVTEKPVLVEADVSLGDAEVVYDGTEKTPAVTVRFGGSALAEGIDYTVSYRDNVNVGDASAVVTGIGGYSGTVTKTFAIRARNVALGIALSKTAYVYDGLSKRPDVTVTDGAAVLDPSTYTVKYPEGSGNVGPHEVSVTMKGGYTGSGTASYQVNPAGTSIKRIVRGKGALTVQWYRNVTQTSGYQVQCSPSKKFKKGARTLSAKGVQKTGKAIKKLKAGKRYYVKVRTYAVVGGKKYYSTWSKVRSAKTAKASKAR